MTVITVLLPEYDVRTEPDHHAIGRCVDAAIRANFGRLKIIARGVRADDHPADEPINSIRIARLRPCSA